MESKRFALNIGVTLSSQLINASLSMLAIIGAMFIFIIDKRETSIGFYILIFISFFSFILSIILGGKGIDMVRKKSFKNKLGLKYSKKFFNNQAFLCLIGIIAALISLAFTGKIPNGNSELNSINNNLEKLLDQEDKIDSLSQEVILIKRRLDSIK